MRLARVLSGVGRLLIWAGALVLLFVAYQLWGTGLAEARAQDDLAEDFAALLESEPTTTTTTTTGRPAGSTATTTTTTTPPPPPPEEGGAVARLVIPRIGVDKIVVEGVSRRDLQRAPGHYPGTPLPGQPGNAAIAGHRTTYGAPFRDIDELEPGDEILVTTRQGSFRYEVIGSEVVLPTQVEVVEDQGDDRLTLTSCHPEYSARQRIVVSARLVDDPAPAPPPTPVEPPGELPDEDLEDEAADAEARDDPAPAGADIEHLDGEDLRTTGPALRWGAVTAAVWLAFYVLSRRWRRWPAYLLGAPVFALTLFVFFGALTEALPANY
jgi:sortase A